MGNTRVIFSDTNNDGEPEILQEADYYPFGMRHVNSTATNHYLYNGKELNTDLGLDWYDYGARWLDVETGRWNGIDPLAENYHSWSGYNYVLNNPISFTDPDGRSVKPTNLTGIALHYVATNIIGAQPYWRGEVTFDIPILGKGRADLVYQGPDGNNAIWEIKPVSYRKEGSLKHQEALDQLERYRQLAEAQTGMSFSTGSSRGAPPPFQGTKKVSFVSGLYQYEASLFIPVGQENKGLIYYTLDSRKLTPAGERVVQATVVTGTVVATAVVVASLPVTAPTAAVATAVTGVAATIAVSSVSEPDPQLSQ